MVKHVPIFRGAEIPADTASPSGGTWTLSGDHIYVLEIHSTSGGFY